MNRQYAQSTARFMRPDPLGGSAADPQSLNRYTYVANDSINLVDPSGLCTINIAIPPNNLLTANQLTALKGEISRIYGNAGYQISFVSSGADYTLTVRATAPDPRAGGETDRRGIRVYNTGRVFVDSLSSSAGTAASFSQNSNNLGITLGRGGAHEIGHYLLQKASHSPSDQGVMSTSFRGEQWYSPATRGLWTFDASQSSRLGNKVCITPEKAPLNYAPIESRIVGGLRGGGLPTGGFGGNWNIFDLLELLGQGTVTSTYKLEPPDVN